MTNPAMPSMASWPRVWRAPGRTGRIINSAGSNVMEKRKARATPMAARLPRSRKGGASLKLRLRKPMAVVSEVRNTGPRLIRRLSSIAVWRSSPLRSPCRKITTMWMQSATERVITTTGVVTVGGLSWMPSQPASPMAPTTARKSTTEEATTPATECSMSIMETRMIATMSG